MIKKFDEFTSEGMFPKKEIVSKIEFPVTDAEIDIICEENGISIEDYDINEDMSIDVAYADLRGKDLKQIPLKFKNSKGCFYCDDNDLTNLEGCPTYVADSFGCAINKLTTLKGCPEYVGYDFYCHHNRLTSLKHCQEEIFGNFHCENNLLYTLEGCPKKISGNIYWGLIPVYDMLNEILFDGDEKTVRRIFGAWDLYSPVYKDKTFFGKERWVIYDYRLRELYVDVTDKEYEGNFPKFKNYTLDKT